MVTAMKRKDFICSAGAFAVASLTGNSIWGQDHSPTGVADYELRAIAIALKKPVAWFLDPDPDSRFK